MTPVIFKRELEGNGVYAAFPTLPGDNSPYTMACYAHIGQHSIVCEQYVRETKSAKPVEYASLLKELRQIGYDDLVIRRRMSRADFLARKAALNGEDAS